MDDRDLLLDQTRHCYRSVASAIAGLTFDQARWPAEGRRPSIAWQVGHLTLLADSVAEAVAGRERRVSEDRGGTPHWGVADAPGWTALAGRWSTVAEHTLAALEALPPPDLALPPAVAIHPSFRAHLTTRRAFWSGHVFHVSYHLGQMGSLRAELGLGWGVPSSPLEQG